MSNHDRAMETFLYYRKHITDAMEANIDNQDMQKVGQTLLYNYALFEDILKQLRKEEEKNF